MRRFLVLMAVYGPMLTGGDEYQQRAKRKIAILEEGKAQPGSVVTFSPQEINSWAKYSVPEIVPEGIRDQRVELGTNTATAYALMDFLKMQQAKGYAPNWIMARIIEGERPVKISIRMESSGGFCTVFLTRVEISGVAATGSILETLVKTFFTPLYPQAHINEKFEIGYNIDRIEIRPSAVRVIMKR